MIRIKYLYYKIYWIFIRDYIAESEILYILELLYVYFLKLMSICYARTNWKWKRQAIILRLPFFIASYVFESLSLSLLHPSRVQLNHMTRVLALQKKANLLLRSDFFFINDLIIFCDLQ